MGLSFVDARYLTSVKKTRGETIEKWIPLPSPGTGPAGGRRRGYFE